MYVSSDGLLNWNQTAYSKVGRKPASCHGGFGVGDLHLHRSAILGDSGQGPLLAERAVNPLGLLPRQLRDGNNPVGGLLWRPRNPRCRRCPWCHGRMNMWRVQVCRHLLDWRGRRIGNLAGILRARWASRCVCRWCNVDVVGSRRGRVGLL